MQFSSDVQEAPTEAVTLGASSLFVDDLICGKHDVYCYYTVTLQQVGKLGDGFGYRYNLIDNYCHASEGCHTLATKCNDTFPQACQGSCVGYAPYFDRHPDQPSHC